jgi:hypothetical protein
MTRGVVTRRGALRRFAVTSIVTVAAMVASIAPAVALPQTLPDDTWMVNSRVRALTSAGGLTWIGGNFDALLNTNGATNSSLTGLTAFTPAGTPAAVSPPTFTGTGVEVWDLHLAPDGVLYVAGKFNYTVGGKTYRHLIGLNPSTGAVVHTYKASPLKSVFSDGVTVYAGGAKLNAYDVATGVLVPGFTPIELLVDDSLRGHITSEAIRDFVPWGPWIVATGQFDYVKIGGAWDPQKVFFRFDPATGAIDPNWAPDNISQSGGAWGQRVLIDGDVMVNAAGGSDYVATYDLASVDSQGRAPMIWHTDTSGSAQAIAFWDASTLIVGGHFEWIEDADTPQCGSNQNPNTGCYYRPRLAALDRATGELITSWEPTVCCAYNGVWATLVEGTTLHIGGEFTKVGGVEQRYYGRLTEPVSP